MPASAGTSTVDGTERATWIVLGRAGERVCAALLDADGVEFGRADVPSGALAEWVADVERARPARWVWSDTPRWYRALLEAGVDVARCHDLRLCHAILRDTALISDAVALREAVQWDAAPATPSDGAAPTLFELSDTGTRAAGPPEDLEEALLEFGRQRRAVDSSPHAVSLRLLLAAESGGALIAVELAVAGLPWDADAHDAILAEALGPRPAGGGSPRKIEDARARVRDALGDPTVGLDSQPRLLRALHRAGVPAQSTSRWELAEYRHPAIQPLLEYKTLARLLAANGWSWLDEWVHDGRFRPVYVPGGVVTGRWASSGGGALQLPRQLRGAVRADPGWRLVIADVAQLEPRVLAAMSGDLALADAAREKDLYAGIVESGAVTTRAEAKIAMLGAMYGATTGDSGRLVPRLRRTFPRAMRLVDDAARTGEDGGVVTTRLGRSSPPPSRGWSDAQAHATEAAASDADESRARRAARDRGRFTRNFVVQGTAAEWALAWMAGLRGRLAAIAPVDAAHSAPRSGEVFARRPHLAFFLHDEIMVHTPVERAAEAAEAVRAAAEEAGRLLFGRFPIDFPLDLRIAETAEKP